MATDPENICEDLSNLELEQLKQCHMCEEEHLLTMFRKDKRGTYGVGNRCKPCWSLWYKNRLAADPNYKQKLAKQRADNHVQNRESYNERHKVDFQKNKTQIYARRKQYYLDNPDKALGEAHRQHLRNALKSGKEAPELLGCNIPFLKKWFDFHFAIDKDFNMDNHGDLWHIDHVLPISRWDLDNIEHKKLCFNWKNLMPLRCTNNLSKNNVIDLAQVAELDRRLTLFSQITGKTYPETPVHILIAKPPNAGSPSEL
jgi:hypothetical protein